MTAKTSRFHHRGTPQKEKREHMPSPQAVKNSGREGEGCGERGTLMVPPPHNNQPPQATKSGQIPTFALFRFSCDNQSFDTLTKVLEYEILANRIEATALKCTIIYAWINAVARRHIAHFRPNPYHSFLRVGAVNWRMPVFSRLPFHPIEKSAGSIQKHLIRDFHCLLKQFHDRCHFCDSIINHAVINKVHCRAESLFKSVSTHISGRLSTASRRMSESKASINSSDAILLSLASPHFNKYCEQSRWSNA